MGWTSVALESSLGGVCSTGGLVGAGNRDLLRLMAWLMMGRGKKGYRPSLHLPERGIRGNFEIGRWLGRQPREPRRLVEQQRRQLPRGQPEQEQPGQPEQQPRLPPRPSSARPGSNDPIGWNRSATLSRESGQIQTSAAGRW